LRLELKRIYALKLTRRFVNRRPKRFLPQKWTNEREKRNNARSNEKRKALGVQLGSSRKHCF